MIRHRLICLFAISIFFYLVSNPISAQNIVDTIITKQLDTIPCEITYVNNFNIFYTYLVKKKRVKDSYIQRLNVERFVLHNTGVIVMEEEVPSDADPTTGWKEANGIIYPARAEVAPQFQTGLPSLYQYLQQYVHVTIRDMKVFGESTVVVLYKLTVHANGKVDSVLVDESSITIKGFDFQARYLEEEIRKTLEEMPLWKPAEIGGTPIDLTVYLPLKFYLNMNQIYLLPSKFLFMFQGRRN